MHISGYKRNSVPASSYCSETKISTKIILFVKNISLLVKSVGGKTRVSEFDPVEAHSRRDKLIPLSCPLTLRTMPSLVLLSPHDEYINKNTKVKVIKILKYQGFYIQNVKQLRLFSFFHQERHAGHQQFPTPCSYQYCG